MDQKRGDFLRRTYFFKTIAFEPIFKKKICIYLVQKGGDYLRGMGYFKYFVHEGDICLKYFVQKPAGQEIIEGQT